MTKPRFKVLGDPHLGRRFVNNVPLHRRGDRERLVREHFLAELDPAGAPLHVTMGDLFDKPQVPYEVVLFAADAYLRAARANRGTAFVILQGNHDDSRDLAEVTAWDVFCRLVAPESAIRCITEAWGFNGYVFLPWRPDQTAVEQLEAYGEFTARAAFGHWDVDTRSAPHNLIPTEQLAALGITKAYTGHDHLPRSFVRDGVEVVVTGSMQPYAHGEDGGQGPIRYRTIGLDEIETVRADECVRVRLQSGETIGEIPDCLQWQVETLAADAAHEIEVTMGSFDMGQVYAEAFAGRNILPTVQEKIDAKWRETITRQA